MVSCYGYRGCLPCVSVFKAVHPSRQFLFFSNSQHTTTIMQAGGKVLVPLQISASNRHYDNSQQFCVLINNEVCSVFIVSMA